MALTRPEPPLITSTRSADRSPGIERSDHIVVARRCPINTEQYRRHAVVDPSSGDAPIYRLFRRIRPRSGENPLECLICTTANVPCVSSTPMTCSKDSDGDGLDVRDEPRIDRGKPDHIFKEVEQQKSTFLYVSSTLIHERLKRGCKPALSRMRRPPTSHRPPYTRSSRRSRRRQIRPSAISRPSRP